MNFHIKPAASLKGSIDLPSSKSYSIRSFILAALGGTSLICQPSNCDDAVVSRHVAAQLGAEVKQTEDNVWQIVAGKKRAHLTQIQVRESGTVLRFVLPLLARLGQSVTVTGEGTLRGRPNAFLTKTLRAMGVDVRGTGVGEGVPILFKGGSFQGGTMTIDGSLSSQFISALLITCPLLTQDTNLKLTGRKLVSQDYITMTLQMLEECGIKMTKKNDRHYQIPGNQVYRGLKRYRVPSDYGLAAFPLAAAALVPSDMVLKGYFNDRFVQADGHIIRLLQAMNVKVQKTARSIKIKGPFKLTGGKFSLKDCPDLVPIMAVLALFADRKTELCDIAHARVKESDRISDLRKELLKVGADIRETSNRLIIVPKTEYRSGKVLNPHKDHRLAMAFSVLGVKIATRVKDMECTCKSYPDFVRDMRAVGAQLIQENV